MEKSPELILTFDLGTSALKAVVFDDESRVLYRAQFPIETYRDDDYGQDFQKAEDWWRAFTSLMHDIKDTDKISLQNIEKIVSTGQMEDCLLLNDDGQALSEVLLYSDDRAEKQYSSIKKKAGSQQLARATAANFDVLMSVNKYLWLRQERPRYFSRHRHLILGAKDYINFRLTGKNCTDYTNASTTGFMDIRKNKWNFELLNELDFSADRLPELKGAGEKIGEVRPEVADELGLASGTMVINGSGDVGASTLGAGARKPGDVYAYLGTTGWLAGPIETPNENPAIYCLSAPDGSGYITAGAVLNAGSPYDWFLTDILQLQENSQDLKFEDYRQQEKKVEKIPAGSEGVLFLPFLRGERSPFELSEKSGAFLGLGGMHTQAHLARSVLEGVGYSLKHNLEKMLPADNVEKINLIGGGSKSQIWPQIIADILEVKVTTLQLRATAPSLGALIIARQKKDFFSGEKEMNFSHLYEIKNQFTPEPDNQDVYSQGYERYRALLEKVQEVEE